MTNEIPEGMLEFDEDQLTLMQHVKENPISRKDIERVNDYLIKKYCLKEEVPVE